MVKTRWIGKVIKCFCDNNIMLEDIKFVNGVYACPHCMMEWTERKIDTYIGERGNKKNE